MASFSLKILGSCFLVWLIFHSAVNMGLNNSFLNAYLDDFLLLPIWLFSAKLLQTKLLAKKYFSFAPITFLWTPLFAGILFEEVVPKLHTAFVRDSYDYLAYTAGSACSFLLQLLEEKRMR